MNVNLHSKNAEASVPEDAVRIKDDIQKDNGVFVYDQQIRIFFSKILFLLALQVLMYPDCSVVISRLCADLEEYQKRITKSVPRLKKFRAEHKWDTTTQHRSGPTALFFGQEKLTLPTIWMNRSRKQNSQNELESLGSRELVSRYFSCQGCFDDTVDRYEHLTLSYVSVVELPPLVFCI